MGTRADFYCQSDPNELRMGHWVGSVGWDGYPSAMPADLLKATSPTGFLRAVRALRKGRNDFTRPRQGWPWPWEDSRLTDYAYIFREGRVRCYHFGHPFDLDTDDERSFEPEGEKVGFFPDMSSIRDVTMGPRSGLIVVRGPVGGGT